MNDRPDPSTGPVASQLVTFFEKRKDEREGFVLKKERKSVRPLRASGMNGKEFPTIVENYTFHCNDSVKVC